MENFELELVGLWEACVEKLFDKHVYVNRLEELLRNHGITEESVIMDVSGGFGFPAIDLAKRGYQIVCNDASNDMAIRTMMNAEKSGAPEYVWATAVLGPGRMTWQEFDELGADAWDALICKGNSLPYAVSWGKKNPDLSKSRSEIKKVLGNFHRILVPGGILYVDKQPEREEEATEKIGEVQVNGRSLYVVNTFRNDKKNRVRNWTLITRDLETGEEKNYPSQGYLLLEKELLSLLRETGFKEVKKHILEGDIYEGFVAKK